MDNPILSFSGFSLIAHLLLLLTPFHLGRLLLGWLWYRRLTTKLLLTWVAAFGHC